MLKLLKYELKKRKNTLIVGVIALAAAEGLALYFLNKQGEYAVLAIVIMFLMLIGVILMTFLDVAIQYYNDFKKAQGTMLFLTPNNGKKIVGSKMLFGAMELFAGLIIVVLSIWLTNTVAVNLGYAGITPQIQSFKEMLNFGVGSSNTWWVVLGFTFLVFLQYLTGQSVAISSITLGRTIMSRNSYNWLWAILLFIAVNFGIQTINGLLIGLMGMKDGLFSMSFAASPSSAEMSGEITQSITKYLVLGGVEYLCWIVATFFLSSKLLDKRIDL